MYCAIDFGTSNSAVAVPDATLGMRLVELEPGQRTMPTAVFYFVDGPEHDGPPRAFGRAAVAAYVDGLDGRLMRSMKSILGSSLIDQTTDVGGGRGVKYLDLVHARSDQRGYALIELTPAGASCDFRATPFPAQAEARLHSQARFQVEAGRAGVVRD